MTELGWKRRPWPVSIRTKMLIYAAMLLALPSVVNSLLVYRTARHALEPEIRAQVAGDAAAVQVAMRELLVAHVDNVRTWAGLDTMRELVVDDVDKSVSRLLESVRDDYGTYLEAFAVNPDGVCIASSRPAWIGRKLSELASVPNSGRGIASELGYSREHRSFYVPLAARIPNPDRPEQSLGTLVAMVDRSILEDVVRRSTAGGKVVIRMLDSQGRVLAGQAASPLTDVLPAWRITAGESRAPSGSSGRVYDAVDSDGSRLIVGEAALEAYRSLPNLGWRIVAAVPEKIALAPVVEVRNGILLAGSFLTLIGVVLAWMLSASISRPIKELTAVASRIAASGRLEEIPPASTGDEVGELTLAFRRMVDNVSAAHAELVQSSKLAFLGELSAGIAHEIRTPLGIIKNSAQLIERRFTRGNDAEGVEFAHFIFEQTDRLNDAVTDLLNFARPAPPQLAETNINDVMDAAVNMLSTEASSRFVSIETHRSSDTARVVCDSNQLSQVFLNLILNAIQACDRDGQVSIITESNDEEATIVVRDTGTGIAPEVERFLFQPFVSQREGGIGLGLAIVKRIVTAHGGTIRAYNRDPVGAEFRVVFPTRGLEPVEEMS